MSTGIIELNDTGIRFEEEGSPLVESPGVAVIDNKQLLLGTDALQQARLQPTLANTQFWHRLSAEPLAFRHEQYRHHADLAFSHLLHLHEAFPECREVIFALPGSFTREQMSLLLGIVQQCPFSAVGLVDSAVAASVAHARGKQLLHMDLQLHQALFTLLGHRDKESYLRRQELDVAPNTGMVALQDRWARGIAEHFMDQTRFDPLHSATTEQALYDQLPAWRRAFTEAGELFLSIQDKTIKLTKHQFIQPVLPLYQTIIDQARKILNSGPWLLSDRLTELPGFVDAAAASGAQVISLPRRAVMTGIWDNRSHIQQPDDQSQLSFIQSLPVAAPDTPQAEQTAPRPAPAPTHLLLDAVAYPLAQTLYVQPQDQSPVTTEARDSTCYCLEWEDGQVWLTPYNQAEVVVDGQPVTGRTRLQIGDTITLTQHYAAAQLIHVQ